MSTLFEPDDELDHIAEFADSGVRIFQRQGSLVGLRVLRAAHPPAGATTIIVASGLLHTPRQLLDIFVGVVLLTVAGWCLNRAMGVPAPVWAAAR